PARVSSRPILLRSPGPGLGSEFIDDLHCTRSSMGRVSRNSTFARFADPTRTAAMGGIHSSFSQTSLSQVLVNTWQRIDLGTDTGRENGHAPAHNGRPVQTQCGIRMAFRCCPLIARVLCRCAGNL